MANKVNLQKIKSEMIVSISFREYSGAAEPLFRKSGNRLSGIGNRRIA